VFAQAISFEESPIRSKREWARLGSNQRPLACEAAVLGTQILNKAPDTVVAAIEDVIHESS
jgi:hypothetical protein